MTDDERPAPAMNLLHLEIARLRLEPGDKLIVRHSTPLSDAHREYVMHALERWAGADFPVLLVPADFELTIVTAEEGDRE